mmetsp:Transcript_34518/g.73550  ORF Transcript_34518/g.73550 Transcript_34518/m.73550 type:complete len:323 (-) Transcript_34518:550-1518(-)
MVVRQAPSTSSATTSSRSQPSTAHPKNAAGTAATTMAAPSSTATVASRNSFDFRPVSRSGSELPCSQEADVVSSPPSLCGGNISAYVSESKDSSMGASSQEAMQQQHYSDTCSMASFARSSACGRSTSELMRGLPQIPSCFRCPVSQRMMEDPVRLDNGKICDRASLATLGYKGPVVPDASLKAAIAGYIELRKHAVHRDEVWKSMLARREEKYNNRLTLRQRQVYGLQLLLEKSRQSLRDIRGHRESGSSSCGSTEAGSVEETRSVESPVSAPTAAVVAAVPPPAEDLHFKCGPVHRPEGIEKHRPPPRKSTWAGLFQGGR